MWRATCLLATPEKRSDPLYDAIYFIESVKQRQTDEAGRIVTRVTIFARKAAVPFARSQAIQGDVMKDGVNTVAAQILD